MKPLFFPCTYVSDSVAQALAACFGQFSVYQPLSGKMPELMRPWIEKGILDVRVPDAKDQKELEMVVKNYLSWANFHIEGSGLKSSLFQTWKDAIPFFTSSSPSQVMADIKKQVTVKSTTRRSTTVSAAKIFLYFAQEFDRQTHEVARDLKQYRQKEADLIRQLKMEDDALTTEFQIEEAQIPDDSAGYMVLDRLEAWVRILFRDIDLSGIFITHIPAVMQELLERTPTAEKLLHVQSIPTGSDLSAEHISWQKKMISDLSYFVKQNWPPSNGGLPDFPAFPATDNTVSLHLYLVPDQIPLEFFSRCTEVEPVGGIGHSSENQLKNTVVGLIEL